MHTAEAAAAAPAAAAAAAPAAAASLYQAFAGFQVDTKGLKLNGGHFIQAFNVYQAFNKGLFITMAIKPLVCFKKAWRNAYQAFRAFSSL